MNLILSYHLGLFIIWLISGNLLKMLQNFKREGILVWHEPQHKYWGINDAKKVSIVIKTYFIKFRVLV